MTISDAHDCVVDIEMRCHDLHNEDVPFHVQIAHSPVHALFDRVNRSRLSGFDEFRNDTKLEIASNIDDGPLRLEKQNRFQQSVEEDLF